MPNPHFRVSHISRSAGQNAIASAAYRAAETLHDYRSPLDAAAYQSGESLSDTKRGQVFSFTNKSGILHKEIYAPNDAPEWAHNREQLWNAVERAEDTSTRWASARLAVDFVASLPRELSHDEHRTLVERFTQDQFTRKGLAVDVAFHTVKARDGGQNPHVHMMVTTREIDAEGFRDKARWMDKKETLTRWRSSWEHHTNRLLEAAGKDERLSLQTYAAQGIDQVGRKSLTREEYALEQQGTRTKHGDENRRIAADNALRDERRRQEQAENSNDERRTWFESFSYRFRGSMEAARDAIHRYRAKDAEKEKHIMSDEPKEQPTESPTDAPSKEQNAEPSTDARSEDMAARLGDTAKAAAQAGRGLVNNEIQHTNATEGELGTIANPITPAQDETTTNERFRTVAGNDTPQQGPGTPPPGISRGGSTDNKNATQNTDVPDPQLDAAASQLTENGRGEDMSARLSDNARADAVNAAATIQQQNQAMMNEQGNTASKEVQRASILDKYRGAADKGIEAEQTQNQGRERDGR